MSVIDDARFIAQNHPQDSGYIVAVSVKPAMGLAYAWPPERRVGFLNKCHGLPKIDVAGPLRNAELYPTWEAAAAAPKSWKHSDKVTTRIIKVQRQPPVVMFEDFPIDLLDRLAEV